MTGRTGWNAKALSLMIVSMLAVGGLFALGFVPTARAAVCDQGGSLITGDWTISTPQVCSGIVYTVDGSVTVTTGGSLTLVNGGLDFAKDAAHSGYALTVSGGGQLILDHSIVTTQTQAIAPYLKLALTVSASTFVMRNGAVLKFPGWFNATGATISLSSSTITGFTSADLSGSGLYIDDNDDSPLIAWASTTATLGGSRIERIYENTSASGGGNVSGVIEGNVTLNTGSTLTAYDSYIGVDYSNVNGLHNEIRVDGTSNAYLYNVTIDRSQDPVQKTNWKPAYVPAAGGTVYLLRWLRALVVDSTGFPVSGATIWSILSPAGTTAQYPDNALATTPSAGTLAYLGRTASGTSAWNRTDPNGNAVIPLYTDQITSASLPNAFSFGNYQLVAAYSTQTAPGTVFFNPYPSIAAQDNNAYVTIPFSGLQVRTGPDLALFQADYPTAKTVIQNQPFTFPLYLHNLGQTPATGVTVAAFLDGNRSAQVAQATVISVTTSVTVNMTSTGVALVGTHTLLLVADPNNVINEGGLAQESNNFANLSLVVQPPPAGFALISTPSPNQVIQPGTTLSVTGYTRDTGQNSIEGVQITIELRSASGVVATNYTVSGVNGFFLGILNVPANTPDGAYTVVATPSATVIQPDSRAVTIARTLPFLDSPVPLLGLPWWLFLVILAIVVGIAVVVTVYFKVYGLGKMVECGECGAFIPEDATTCPKCGVEFEKDMAKCSNCQAWIPVDVKECPECGVEFATGQVDMANYQEKMRLQYDEVVGKLRQDASRQLGRALSDAEFQEWWRKQPSFVTFEDWLHEEEDMRKQGSRACPVCGTLNSVTAKVCHKCGSMMSEAAAKPTKAGTGGLAPKARLVRPGAGQPPSGGASAQGPAPVVQKRIVRKPPIQGETAPAEESTDQQTDKGEEL